LTVSFAALLFSIVLVADFAAVPYLSSNVPFPMHGFNGVFHFHALYYNELLSFIILVINPIYADTINNV
jgi:hypothetical protein